MNKSIIKYLFIGIAIYLISVNSVSAQQHQHSEQHNNFRSPYVEQLDSPVRGLSSEEVDNLLNGRGSGYARMAELNGYPGLRHVLDLSSELKLSAQQETDIQVAFEQMQSQAKTIGKTIVSKEQELGKSFASGKITNTELEKQTEELATLYGELRNTHLQAHLKINPILSTEQIKKYNQLRGYEIAN
ncbi:Spy/CpxP family protein refolding chaperone [Pleurocapsa sp. PCC 7319]|uniref:Spy/CpxP family protein refolding chaperone n=1 Tax=Pleurocapsa sp. PCC 7319 TaxID=118161 RepID=UPI00034D0F1C|nr:Spy/CpxP family protein refolding chaperone [Pleurocapsa sp. PCC 7319]